MTRPFVWPQSLFPRKPKPPAKPLPPSQRTLEREQRVARLLWACLVAAGAIDPVLVPVEMALMPPRPRRSPKPPGA